MRRRPIQFPKAIFTQSGFCPWGISLAKWRPFFRFQRAGSGCWQSATTSRGRTVWGDRRQGNGAAPAILTPEALSSLRERLKTPPNDGGLWTGPKVARWLASFHSLESVHGQRGWDALIAIKYSIQKPRPRHPKAAGEADRAELKKTARGRR